MQIDKYLQKHQPVIYQTFVNALRSDKLSHAYLLSGSQGMPLLETATYLAKSILCDSPNPLACNTCMTCIRVDDRNYPDVIIINGESGRIKKGDIESIINNFDKTALEEKGIMIYILHLAETATPVAVNALLKFLEEPGKNVFAFLTTQNESKILPTIISRTQVLRFKAIDRDIVIADAFAEGVSEEDAQMLSAFYNDPDSIKKSVESDSYVTAKKILQEELEALTTSIDDAIFISQRKVIPALKDNQEAARLYILMLSEVFKDLLSMSVNEDITLKCYYSYLEDLSTKISNPDKIVQMLITSVTRMGLNLNIPLLLDHIIYKITKEFK